MTHPAALDPARLKADCEIRFTRRSGPGGQNRNKVETAVILRHGPTGLIAEANERRSQLENGEAALFRLRLLLALEIREFPSAEVPSELWRSRLRGGRIAINPAHEDFPTLLAEALDVVASKAFELKLAAEALSCSSSQLTKFLKHEPRALALVNAERRKLGLGVLK